MAIRKLFLIDGIYGAGKTQLIDFLNKSRVNCNIVKKYTTRDQLEENRKFELESVSEDEFDRHHRFALGQEQENQDGKRFYWYKYRKSDSSPCGYLRYGVYRHEILDSIMKYENSFLIVRSVELIKKLVEDFGDVALVIPVFVHTDIGVDIDKMHKAGKNNEEIEVRLKEIEETWDDYKANGSGVDTPYKWIINNDMDLSYFNGRISALIERYDKKREREDMLYIKSHERYHLGELFGTPNKSLLEKKLETYPFEKNVFLMMYYGGEKDTLQYASQKQKFDFIKDELERAGYNCVRADEPEWDITGDITNPLMALMCCKYGIALFDEVGKYNNNVIFELSRMLNQRKETLILKHRSLEAIPFDIMQELYTPYTNEMEWKNIIDTWINKLPRIPS
ncbi:MAG: hypothetical protein LBN02_10520 [Oscillospiraceae bacterium]|jgi:hypothetical protein|nr:hypothetical protein [Oscillospiraceae bacterium]